MRILFHILLIIGFAFKSSAQNFVWNKVYGGSDNDNLFGICNSGSKQYIYVTGFFSEANSQSIKPQIKLGTFTLTGKHLGVNQYLAKMDTSGRVIWAKVIFEKNGATVDPRSFQSDKNDNLYISAGLDSRTDSTRIFPNSPVIINPNAYTSKNFGHTSFIIKVDSSGNFVWQKVFTTGAPGLLTTEKNKLYIIIRNVYRLPFYYGKDTIKDKNYILMQMNDSGKQERLNGLLSLKKENNFNANIPLIDSNELVIFVNILGDTIQYNNTKIAYPILTNQNTILVRLRFSLTTGDLIESYTLTDKPSSSFIHGAIKIGYKRYAISGALNDSLCLRSYKKIISKSGSLSSYCAIINNNTIVNVMYSQPAVQGQFYQSQFFNVNYNNNFIYLFGNAYKSVKYDGFTTTNKDGNNIFLKVDTLGNVLWVTRAGADTFSYYNCFGYAFDKASALYFGNDFRKNISIDHKNYYSKDSSGDFLISKIYDFSITRGNVSKGPYCAGDSFKIPYSKDGNFDTSNIFIAELSDEEGNFTGIYREIGRLKSYKDSFITGILPLLDIPTSSKYRIRIISTKPQVQSYYRYDSLRFLIYSKDTANAGNDTTICYGTQLPIKTSGGSQWRWSPGSMVVDSTARKTDTKPIVKPTRFRIIISDSRGCGKIDTAYKWVYPMQPLKILNVDTMVCRGSAKISFRKSGGVPPVFQYQWLTLNKKLLAVTPTIIINDTTPLQLLMVVSDVCSSNDSLLINIKRYDSLKLYVTRDTSICKALPVKITVGVKGGLGNYKYAWRNNLNQVISNNDTLKLDNRNNNHFSVSVSDNCTNPIDSQAIKINLYEPLTLKLPKDTQLCYNKPFNIKPLIIKGAKVGSYWFVFDNGFIKDSLLAEQTVKAFNYPSNITVKAKNLCNETIANSFNVNVLQKLKLNGANDIELCKGNLVNLKINASGGLNPKIKWLENNNNLISFGNKIDTAFNVKSSTKFTFIGFDNCSVPNDTVNMNLTVLPELKVNIQDPPYCFKDAVNLNAKIRGGKVSDYQIKWQDANGSLGIDSSLFYNTGNNIRTLYFSLKDNCSVPFFDTIVLIPMSIAKIDINDSAQCFKDNYFDLSNQLENVKGSSVKSDWYYATEFIPSAKDSTRLTGTFNTSGKYSFKLIVRSKGSCLDSSQVLAEVYPVPFIKITWKRTTNNFAYSTWRYEANATEPIKKYTWFVNQFAPQAGNPVFQDIDSSGHVRVKLIGEDFNGCFYDTIINYEMVHRLQFYIPNIITMNGDGINDNFVIQGKEYMKTYHLEIYNRWGEKVFQSDNPDEAWIPNDFSNNFYNFMLSILDVYDDKHLVTGVFGVLR